jgi:hypothetical protein
MGNQLGQYKCVEFVHKRKDATRLDHSLFQIRAHGKLDINTGSDPCPSNKKNKENNTNIYHYPYKLHCTLPLIYIYRELDYCEIFAFRLT